MDLRYRLAVVTGGGSGLGREIAVALSRAGAAVLVADRDLAAAEETAELVRAGRVRAWTFQVDLTEETEIRLLAARARDLGGMDLLVNNAGGWTPGDRQWPRAPAEDWSRTLDLDLRAPMRLTQLFVEQVPDLRGRRDGTPAVVNVGSVAGSEHGAYGSPEYAAAKAGLVRFTTACSDPATTGGARVMAVVPGWIGLDRAHAQVAALPAQERTALPPLVPPAEVTRAVVDLLRTGVAGQVVDLPDGGGDRLEIASLVRAFFGAFTSGPDVGARIDGLRELFLPAAVVVVRALDGGVTAYDVEGFLEPRRTLLEGPTLTGFSEWQVSGRTDVLGDVAVHVCSYAKQWVQDGGTRTGSGHKTLQLVRTPQGWRISALAWADER